MTNHVVLHPMRAGLVCASPARAQGAQRREEYVMRSESRARAGMIVNDGFWLLVTLMPVGDHRRMSVLAA